MFTKSKIFALAVVPLVWGMASYAATPSDQNAAPGAPPEHHWDAAAHHKTACTQAYAFHAARLSFVEAELDLTDQQRPLFAKWRQAILDGAAKEKTACLEAAAKPEMHPNFVERLDHEEKTLALKVQTLQASHAALQAFYEFLTPAQRALLDHAHEGHGGPRGEGGHEGWQHGGGEGPGPGPGGPGGPGRDHG